ELWRHAAAVCVAAIHGRQGHLLQVIHRDHACGGFTNFLHSRQQQTDQDTDDGDHHQQFDERKGPPFQAKEARHERVPPEGMKKDKNISPWCGSTTVSADLDSGHPPSTRVIPCRGTILARWRRSVQGEIVGLSLAYEMRAVNKFIRL